MMRRLWPVLGATLAAAATLAVLAVSGTVSSQSRSPAPAWPGGIGQRADFAPADHVGSAACAGCHAAEAQAWSSSHHALAMAEATPATVRGDFSGVTASQGPSKARFFKEDGRPVVETEGRDGKTARFAVTHTFGWEPLQQYLVAFPDGRRQALPWAWDTRPEAQGGQRWFHVYGDEPIPHGDSRHWTRSQQTWNYMCAECHSTALDKGYDAATNTYKTTWSEVSVGCESCHGAGRGHIDWATAGAAKGVALKGFASAPSRRGQADWSPDPRTGSPAAGVARPPGDEVETCARCHVRRSQIAADWRPGRPLGDTHLPTFLTPDLFEDDGQMKDEVFNDHPFRQSAMYAKGVSCGDCHDPHSAKLKADGAAVCSACHVPERFAAVTHTGHAAGPGAPDCISCHMPAKTYMVVDRRHDHSFRVPRPDLTATLGTPNTCTACHADKPAAWAADAVTRWHGPVRKDRQAYAAAFHAARTGDISARERLIRVATDKAMPAPARATAVDALAAWPSADQEAAVASAIADPDPLVRVAALRGQSGQPAEVRWRRGGAALADPVRIVRQAAASLLADQSTAARPAAELAALNAATAELEASYRLEFDRPEGRASLGVLRQRQGRLAEAEAAFLSALQLEPGAATVSVTLADLYRTQGREAAAEQVLRAALGIAPDSAIVRHALGLSLIRSRRYPEALENLARATTLDPGNARFSYVYAVALQSTGRAPEAGRILRAALARHPADADILGLLLQQALQSNDAAAAAPLARTLSQLRPDDAGLARLAERLK
jgi:predicted CXXCH cytochrome family protein